MTNSRRVHASTVVAALALASLSPSESHPQSLEKLNQREALERASGTLAEFEGRLDSMSRSRKLACLKAFGLDSFCSCIADKLPVLLSFSDYVAIVVHSKAENNYDKLNSDFRLAYDTVPAVRDQCVAALIVP